MIYGTTSKCGGNIEVSIQINQERLGKILDSCTIAIPITSLGVGNQSR